ncbi:patatin-like phospholipase family protein [Thalassolituus sp. LLYu03]|uniref:patatin-like phospholipase family protein n=1 Tax=Thalassolituus sp. LLYu03 TaxID=3421656 RepID=UPI003D272563
MTPTISTLGPATSALVVEGGAMRGIFAAGVLDQFMQAEYYPFDFAMGVSAGATNLASYVTRQQGRSHKIITEYATQRDFFNPLRAIRGGDLTDVDWLWNYAHDQLPLKTQLLSSSLPFYAVVSRVRDGEPRYLRVTPNNVHALMVASCALPFAFRKPVVIEDVRYVDGGVSDSIPVRKAWEMGARDITVVLSRPWGYHKKEAPAAEELTLAQRMMQRAVKRMFGDDAGIWQTMHDRAADYNRALEFIENPQLGCRINVIAPPDDFAVSRLTMNDGKLQAGYEMGVVAAEQFLKQGAVQAA